MHVAIFAGFKVHAMKGMGEVEGSASAGQTVAPGLGYDQGPLTAAYPTMNDPSSKNWDVQSHFGAGLRHVF